MPPPKVEQNLLQQLLLAATFPLMVLLMIVSVPLFHKPPPCKHAVLPLTVQRLSVSTPLFTTLPPEPPKPCWIVIPVSVTLALVLEIVTTVRPPPSMMVFEAVCA